jgi:NADH:ubiquinone oxidoreductase subunit 4 (subunit M)
MDGFHIFKIATVLALWGVVISTVYMLRAYRKTFHGHVSEQWKQLVELRPTLRVPVTLLVGALICCGFFRRPFCEWWRPRSARISRRTQAISRHADFSDALLATPKPRVGGCAVRQP